MPSSSRARVRAPFAAALSVLLALGCVHAARAQAAPSFWFAGTRLILTRTQSVDGNVAVSVRDPAFVGFLSRLGATVSWQPGERYVVVTASDGRTITFTLGSNAYRDGTSAAQAPFTPFATAADAFIPFATVARALYVSLVPENDETVLEPQIGGLDVRQEGPRTIVTLQGAVPMRFRKTAETSERLVLTFPGVATTLQATRQIDTAGLTSVAFTVGGDPRNPSTTVVFDGAALSIHAMYPNSSARAVTIAFAPEGVALAGGPVPSAWDGTRAEAAVPETSVAAAPPAAPVRPAAPTGPPAALPAPLPSERGFAPIPAQSAGPTMLTAVDVTPSGPGAVIRVALGGPARYEWHRLPDGRWYVDFHDVSLGIAAVDRELGLPAVQSLRVQEISFGPPLGIASVVRLALTLNGDHAIRIAPAAGGVTVTVAPTPETAVATSGIGAEGFATAAVPSAAPVGTPAAVPAGTNPRLIVLDPGHGGTDTGAMGNGLVEKVLTLDIALQLRTILQSRGWVVKMTRTQDTDVVAPNDDARTELQGRCDIANNAGARLFVSIHINAFTDPAVHGTTTFYYKPDSATFAEDVERRLVADLGTQDDGARRGNIYVVRHTTMPAILVETAFLSSPSDAAKLKDPAFLHRVAVGIAEGIGDYAGSPNAPLPALQRE